MKTTQLHTYNNYKLREHQKIMLNILKKKINRNFNGKVLDIGCAQGVFLKNFKEYFKKSNLEGVDTSKDLIDKCKILKIPNSNFYKKDFLNLKKKIAESKFSYEEFENFYFFPSGRWDLKLKNNILIKLPENKINDSLDYAFDFMKNNNIEDFKVIDLRVKKQIILND